MRRTNTWLSGAALLLPIALLPACPARPSTPAAPTPVGSAAPVGTQRPAGASLTSTLPPDIADALRASMALVDSLAETDFPTVGPIHLADPAASEEGPDLYVLEGPVVARRRVDACLTTWRKVIVCEASHACSTVDGARRSAIICDAAYLERLARVQRIAGSAACFREAIKSDRDLVALLPFDGAVPASGGSKSDAVTPTLDAGAPADVASLPAPCRPPREGLVALFAFVLAHEIGHIVSRDSHPPVAAIAARPSGAAGRAAPTEVVATPELLGQLHLCLAQDELDAGAAHAHGGGAPAKRWAASIALGEAVDWPGPVTDLTHRWEIESDADRFAAERLAHLADRDGAAFGRAAAQALALDALGSWYKHLDGLVGERCAPQGRRDFALTRCSCFRAPGYHADIARYFEATHPPKVARMRRVLEQLRASTPAVATAVLEEMAEWGEILDVPLATARALAHEGCGALLQPARPPPGFVAYPALEGLSRGAPGGYPDAALAADMRSDCAETPAPPAPPVKGREEESR